MQTLDQVLELQETLGETFATVVEYISRTSKCCVFLIMMLSIVELGTEQEMTTKLYSVIINNPKIVELI